MNRVLVVGGTGFIGLAVVDALLEEGIAVRASRRRRSITALLRKRPVELVSASLDDVQALERAMRGCDAVIVCAGHYPRYSLDRSGSVELAVAGVRNACDAALRASIPRFVFTSSTGSLSVAPPGRLADERDIPTQMPNDSVYRAVKYAMEREVESWSRRGLPAVTILPGGCFGPGDLRLGTGGILVGAIRELLPWYVEGVVPIVDVADVANAHVAAAKHPRPRSRYCVAGRPLHVSALLEQITARWGGTVPPRIDAVEARRRADADERAAAPTNQRVPIPREMVDIVLCGQPISSRRAERDLGTSFRPLTETLDRAHAFFQSVGYLPAPCRASREAS